MSLRKSLLPFALCAGVTAMGAVGVNAGQLAGKNIILVQGFQPQHVFMKRPHDGGKRFGYNYWNKFGLFNNGNGAIQVADPVGPSESEGSLARTVYQFLPKLKNGNNVFAMYDTRYEAVYKDAEDPNAKILYFDSSRRLSLDGATPEEKAAGSIAGQLVEQLEAFFAEKPNFCKATNGCIVITHSTGDLAMQWIEENKYGVLNASTREAFDVTAYLDLAGARGGTEGASWLLVIANILKNASVIQDLSQDEQEDLNLANKLLNLLFGSTGVTYLEPGMNFNGGVLNDLQPHIARQVDAKHPDATPHLRVASAGDEPWAFIAHPIIRGYDDSVVPLHSACGSSKALNINTCVWGITLKGKKTIFTDAPHGHYWNHFPFIQSDQLRHSGHQWNDTGNTMVPLMDNGKSIELDIGESTVEVSNGQDLVVDFEVRTYWDWTLHKHVLIRDADKKTLSQVLTQSLE